MLVSDGSLVRFGEGVPHPRYYGTFPRLLARYVREKQVLPLEEAVRKMTSAPARRAGLWDRGLLIPGLAADLVLFDPTTITDHATFAAPHNYPSGVEMVIVNGEIAWDAKGMTAHRAGKVLRK
jgi:dihydroorotase/N-acyl-D-amino-acid deacylase